MPPGMPVARASALWIARASLGCIGLSPAPTAAASRACCHCHRVLQQLQNTNRNSKQQQQHMLARFCYTRKLLWHCSHTMHALPTSPIVTASPEAMRGSVGNGFTAPITGCSPRNSISICSPARTSTSS